MYSPTAYRQAVPGDFLAPKYGACTRSCLVLHLAAVYGFFTSALLLASSGSHGPVSTCNMPQPFQPTGKENPNTETERVGGDVAGR